MREKDLNKQEAIIEATIKVVNDIGFASASISKIAKEAGTSKSTIYIYYKHKEDLVVSVYYDVKRRVSRFFHKDLHVTKLSTEENLRRLWTNTIVAQKVIPELISYDIQFSNSPFYELLESTRLHTYSLPTKALLKKGISEGMLDDISHDMFTAYFTEPALFLASKKMSQKFMLSQENIEDSFQRALKTITPNYAVRSISS